MKTEYRIQKRLYSSNILEKKIKDKWVEFIAPLENKEKGDIECERLLKIYTNFKN